MKIKTVSRVNDDEFYDVQVINGSFACPKCQALIEFEEPDTLMVVPIPNVTCPNCNQEYTFLK